MTVTFGSHNRYCANQINVPFFYYYHTLESGVFRVICRVPFWCVSVAVVAFWPVNVFLYCRCCCRFVSVISGGRFSLVSCSECVRRPGGRFGGQDEEPAPAGSEIAVVGTVVLASRSVVR